MIVGNHYYHGLTKKYISTFGSVLNDITVVKYNKARTAELGRTKVPVVYTGKEKYVVREGDDPNLNKQIQVTLPVISYQMTGLIYNPMRKQNALLKDHGQASTINSRNFRYVGVPYDLQFDVSIYTRNQDDGYQIVEQVLPLFTPDYNVSVNLQTEMGIVLDIPIILNSVENQVQFEGDFETTRIVEWNLNFTMQCFYYGPTITSKIIKRAFANTYIDPSLSTGYITRMNMSDLGANNNYKLEEVVYQGTSEREATAAGIVVKWDANSLSLHLGSVQGQFRVNSNVHSTTTNAVYKIQSFDVTPLKLVSQKFEVDPITANTGDPYGIKETIIEYPDTIE